MQLETQPGVELPVLALDSVFDTNARRNLTVPPRSSVADMVAAAYPGTCLETRRDIVVATIDGQVVPVEAWGSVRPKLGTTVILKPVPQGDVLRNVLVIAVTVAAIAAGQLYAPQLAGALGFSSAAGSLSVAATSSAITATTPHVGSAVMCLLRA